MEAAFNAKIQKLHDEINATLSSRDSDVTQSVTQSLLQAKDDTIKDLSDLLNKYKSEVEEHSRQIFTKLNEFYDNKLRELRETLQKLEEQEEVKLSSKGRSLLDSIESTKTTLSEIAQSKQHEISTQLDKQLQSMIEKLTELGKANELSIKDRMGDLDLMVQSISAAASVIKQSMERPQAPSPPVLQKTLVTETSETTVEGKGVESLKPAPLSTYTPRRDDWRILLPWTLLAAWCLLLMVYSVAIPVLRDHFVVAV